MCTGDEKIIRTILAVKLHRLFKKTKHFNNCYNLKTKDMSDYIETVCGVFRLCHEFINAECIHTALNQL